MGSIRNPRWEQKRTEGYVIVSNKTKDRVTRTLLKTEDVPGAPEDVCLHNASSERRHLILSIEHPLNLLSFSSISPEKCLRMVPS